MISNRIRFPQPACANTARDLRPSLPHWGSADVIPWRFFSWIFRIGQWSSIFGATIGVLCFGLSDVSFVMTRCVSYVFGVYTHGNS